MVKGGEISDFGGGSLEPPRRWRGAQWPGPHSGSAELPQSRPARAEEVQELSWGVAKGGTLTMFLDHGRLLRLGTVPGPHLEVLAEVGE